MLICMVTGWFSLNYFTKGHLAHSFTVAVFFFLLMISNYLLGDLGSACLGIFSYTFTICLRIQQCSGHQICSWGTPA